MQKEIRWHYRFKNFSRAFALLREAAETESLTDLEKEGLIQRFKYTFELGWKMLKDRLEYNDVELPSATPRDAIKEAFAAKFIKDSDAWLDMQKARNNMSHNYNSEKFEEIVENIRFNYAALLGDLHAKFGAELDE